VSAWWNQSNDYKKAFIFSFLLLGRRYIILNFYNYDSRYVSLPEIEKETPRFRYISLRGENIPTAYARGKF
jgi:hypothetical protein